MAPGIQQVEVRDAGKHSTRRRTAISAKMMQSKTSTVPLLETLPTLTQQLFGKGYWSKWAQTQLRDVTKMVVVSNSLS